MGFLLSNLLLEKRSRILLNFNFSRLRLLNLRESNVEHTVFAVGLNLIGVNLLRQNKGACDLLLLLILFGECTFANTANDEVLAFDLNIKA